MPPTAGPSRNSDAHGDLGDALFHPQLTALIEKFVYSHPTSEPHVSHGVRRRRLFKSRPPPHRKDGHSQVADMAGIDDFLP